MTKYIGPKIHLQCRSVLSEERISFGIMVWQKSDVVKCDPAHENMAEIPFLEFLKA